MRGVPEAAPPVSVRAAQTLTPGAATSGRRTPLAGSDCGVHVAGSASVVVACLLAAAREVGERWFVWS